MSCATPDAVDWFSGRDDGDVELLEAEGFEAEGFEAEGFEAEGY
jgi:hypothetical protein